MSKPSRPRHVYAGEAAPIPWEPVWEGAGEADALIVAGSFDADGIRARTQGSSAGLAGSAWGHERWAVFVPLSHADEARQKLRERGDESSIVSAEPASPFAACGDILALSLGLAALVLLIAVIGLLR